jgi:hypothetical protein
MHRFVFAFLMITVFTATSCGPSLCDCLNAGDDTDLIKECKEKFPTPKNDKDKNKRLQEVEKCEIKEK